VKNPGKWLTKFEKERTKVFQRLHGMALGILTSASIGERRPLFRRSNGHQLSQDALRRHLWNYLLTLLLLPQNHSTASVFLLCGSSLLSCTPAVDRLMSESHVATNSGGVSLPDCIWKLTSLGRIVSCSSKSRVSDRRVGHKNIQLLWI